MKTLTEHEKEIIEVKAVAKIQQFLAEHDYNNLSDLYLQSAGDIALLLANSNDGIDHNNAAYAIYHLKQTLELLRPFAITLGQI